ncbi:MAG: cation:proton antiporter [FCB group bacterium]|nr:cation:proton antiporter [FCB group bacterium]
MPIIDPKEIALQLGLLFLSAVVFGRIARLFKTPRVAGYLIGGMILGPHFLGLIESDSLSVLEPLTKFALALILFEIGTNFEFKRVKQQGRNLLPIIIADVFITSLFVFFSIFLSGGGLKIAALLAVMAIATAPATTMLVLKEYHAEGEMTDKLISLVGINNMASIILFEIILVLMFQHSGIIQLLSNLSVSILYIISACVLGIISGVLISYLEQKVTGSERIILFIAIVVIVFGVSQLFNLPYMLLFLIMGLTVVNTSDFTMEILVELDRIGWPLYVLFFLTAGAKLHLDSLQSLGIISIVYILARSIGKIGGIAVITKLIRRLPDNSAKIGPALLSQAGVAIGLTMNASQRLPDIGAELETVIVSTIVVFEILGPILVRMSVVGAGEVKIIHLIDRPLTTPYSLSIRALAKKLAAQAGVGPWESPANIAKLQVHQVMLKNIKSIPVEATFPEIMSFISHSRFNIFPVTSTDRHYEGVISYPEIREVIYDPQLFHLMIAKDFARMKHARIETNKSLNDALEKFHELNMDCLPVVDSSNEKLVGMLEQREVLRLCGKNRLS